MPSRALLATLLLVSLAQAKEPVHTQNGVLLRMNSVDCGYAAHGDSAHKSHKPMCQEYTMYTDTMIYRFRPRDEQHPFLLPVGNLAQFHLEKGKLVLRVEDLDDKDRDYTLMSVTPRDDEKSETRTSHLNHLQ